MTRRLWLRARRGAFDAALIPWVTARLVVLGALALAHYLVGHLHAPAAVALRVHEGLLGWDAGYYRDIAVRGYAGLPRPAIRFFPLLPLVVRWLHDGTRLPVNDVLLAVTNLSALVAGILLYRLALAETGNERVGRMAAWMLAFAPSSFVLAMGYSEGPLILLSIAFFLALRSGRWWAAAACGYLAGLTRPFGALLAVPALVEVVGLGRQVPVHVPSGRLDDDDLDSPGSRWAPGRLGRVHPVARLITVLAAPAGTLTYLAWVAARFGSFWLPLREQEQGNLRGHFADPITTAGHDLRDLFHGHIGTGLHVPWLVLFVVLALISLWRWPTAYGAFAVATLALAVSSTNFDSLERYALSAFPLVLALAGVVQGERREWTVVALSAAVLLAYALLAFLNALVP
jgi:hypothetical protein